MVGYYEAYLEYVKSEGNTPEGYFNKTIEYLQTNRFDGIDFNFLELEDR